MHVPNTHGWKDARGLVWENHKRDVMEVVALLEWLKPSRAQQVEDNDCEKESNLSISLKKKKCSNVNIECRESSSSSSSLMPLIA